MSENIFILSELYAPAETGTGFMMGKIAEGLATQNTVTAICGYSVGQNSNNTPSKEHRNGVIVVRCRGTKLNKDNLFFRTLNLITISISIFLKAFSSIHPEDKILVVTNPPSLPYVALVVCKLRRAQCYLLVYDLYPEVLTATGMLRADSTIAYILNGLSNWLYNQMNKIIVLGRDMHAIVSRRFPTTDSRLTIIPNWADTDEILPMSRESNILLKNLEIKDKFVVQYSGNIGRTHGIETLLDTAKHLKGSVNIHFLFAGAGAKKQWLSDNVKKFELTNITVIPLQPRKDLSILLNACDVAVISFIPGMAGISVPSRMYSIMGSGKPIIAVADEESELALVVREENIGWVVPPGNYELLCSVIIDAQSDPEKVHDMGKRARLVAEQKYPFKKILGDYQRLFSA